MCYHVYQCITLSYKHITWSTGCSCLVLSSQFSILFIIFAGALLHSPTQHLFVQQLNATHRNKKTYLAPGVFLPHFENQAYQVLCFGQTAIRPNTTLHFTKVKTATLYSNRDITQSVHHVILPSVYIYIHIQYYIYMYIHIHVYVYTYIHNYIYIYIHNYIYIYIHNYIYIYT